MANKPVYIYRVGVNLLSHAGRPRYFMTKAGASVERTRLRKDQRSYKDGKPDRVYVDRVNVQDGQGCMFTLDEIVYALNNRKLPDTYTLGWEEVEYGQKGKKS